MRSSIYMIVFLSAVTLRGQAMVSGCGATMTSGPQLAVIEQLSSVTVESLQFQQDMFIFASVSEVSTGHSRNNRIVSSADSRNEWMVVQVDATDCVAVQELRGAGNLAIIFQTGVGNGAWQYQSGNASSIIVQSGCGNKAVSRQE